MRLYVAAKWEQRGRAAAIADLLEQKGHEITARWWDYESFGMDPDTAREDAVRDMTGVKRADALVALLEDDLPYRGVWCEFGAAVVLGKPVYVIGDEWRKCVFGFHPLVRPYAELVKGGLS